MRCLLRVVVVCLSACSAGHASAAAPRGPQNDHDAVRRAVEAGNLKPLADILKQLERRQRGRVLDVELERDAEGRQVYEVKLLEPDGRRRALFIDAVSGVEIKQAAGPGSAAKPLATVLRQLLALYPGQVLDVELERGLNNRQVYEVRIMLEDGRVRELIVDSISGELLEDQARRLVPMAALKPLPYILEMVLARHPGTVREIELEHDRNGRRFYEIELRLDDGRLLEVHVDAVSGVILQADPSD